MKKTLTVLLASILFLTGCSQISSGTITKKEHEPGNYYITTICNLVGKVTVCTPITQYDNEDWRFDIHEGDKDGFVYVTPETFDSYEVGDYFKEN